VPKRRCDRAPDEYFVGLARRYVPAGHLGILFKQLGDGRAGLGRALVRRFRDEPAKLDLRDLLALDTAGLEVLLPPGKRVTSV
jgi:uncharacterized protein (DUF3820 family)